jgi:hypothetical protein
MRRLPGWNGPLVLLALLALGGCRPVAVISDPSPYYAIEVDNRMPHAMLISYDDGETVRSLGTVAANSRDRFVIAQSARAAVTIIAQDQGGTHTVRRDVVLRLGSTVDVRL